MYVQKARLILPPYLKVRGVLSLRPYRGFKRKMRTFGIISISVGYKSEKYDRKCYARIDTSQNEVQQRLQDKILVPSGLFSERRKNRRVPRHFLDEHAVSLPFFFFTCTLCFITLCRSVCSSH